MGKRFISVSEHNLWDVELQSGEYDDWVSSHLYFRAQDEKEVWDMLCEYMEQIFVWKEKKFISWHAYLHPVAIISSDRKKSYACKKWLEATGKKEEEVDWGTAYGDAKEVNITRLSVINQIFNYGTV